MRARDLIAYAWLSVRRQGLRALMLVLAMTISVASVLLLTALGDGAKRYVAEEFSLLGKDMLVILPGRKETTGGLPPLTGAAARDLTLRDMRHLARHLPGVRLAPLVVGTVEVARGGLSREVMVLGTTAAFFHTHNLTLTRGQGLPAIDPERAQAVCVIGSKLAQTLFRQQGIIGERLRLGDARCRVIGVFAGSGSAMGMDLEDDLIVPVASAQSLFNAPALFRLFVQAPGQRLDSLGQRVLALIAERHQGEADVTLLAPDAMLATFREIMTALTAAVAGIAAISLAVAGILLMNISLINIHQRTAEVGLLKALGASAGQVRALFMAESALLSLSGTVAGILVGQGGVLLARGYWAEFPLYLVPWSVPAAAVMGVGVGLLFSWLPARRAAALDPVASLRGGG